MASVYLNFIPPPDTHDLSALHVWESNAPDGIFTRVQTFTNIGTYPDWIDWVEVTTAVNDLDWFAIQWETAAGVEGQISNPVQGSTQTLLGEIVSRVKLRDPLLDENVVQQEAEAVIETVLPGVDPYTVDRSSITAKQKSGITFLTLARSYLSSIITSISSGSAQSYTAGLVSQSAGSGTSNTVTQGLSNVQQLIDWANRDLGLNYSLIMLIKEIPVAGNCWPPNITNWTLESLGL